MKIFDHRKIEAAGFTIEMAKDMKGNAIGLLHATKGNITVHNISGDRYRVSVVGKGGVLTEALGVKDADNLLELDKLING